MKNLGLILLVIGAVLLILPMALQDVMGDLADQNWYTIGSVALIFLGMVAHVVIKKLEVIK